MVPHSARTNNLRLLRGATRRDPTAKAQRDLFVYIPIHIPTYPHTHTHIHSRTRTYTPEHGDLIIYNEVGELCLHLINVCKYTCIYLNKYTHTVARLHCKKLHWNLSSILWKIKTVWKKFLDTHTLARLHCKKLPWKFKTVFSLNSVKISHKMFVKLYEKIYKYFKKTIIHWSHILMASRYTKNVYINIHIYV